MKGWLLTEKLKLSRMKTVSDIASDGRPEWCEEEGFIRAELLRNSGSQRREGGEVYAAYDATFRVNLRHDVRAGDRVRHLTRGGLLYKVETIIPNRRRGILELHCAKVNL